MAGITTIPGKLELVGDMLHCAQCSTSDRLTLARVDLDNGSILRIALCEICIQEVTKTEGKNDE